MGSVHADVLKSFSLAKLLHSTQIQKYDELSKQGLLTKYIFSTPLREIMTCLNFRRTNPISKSKSQLEWLSDL